MATMKTRADVFARLNSYNALIYTDAGVVNHAAFSAADRWRVVRTVTRQLLRAYGVTERWTVEPLPHQARWREGDSWLSLHRIRYSREWVENWYVEDLTQLIIHEVAHAIVETEAKRRGQKSPNHGPMWKGQMAVMGIPTKDRFHQTA